jgi:hypothetical protein
VGFGYAWSTTTPPNTCNLYSRTAELRGSIPTEKTHGPGLGMVMCQHRLSHSNVFHSGGGCQRERKLCVGVGVGVGVGAGVSGKSPNCPLSFCCEPKSALKTQSYLNQKKSNELFFFIMSRKKQLGM